MRDTQQVRRLLGPADPARGVTVPPPRASARDLIIRAEARSPRPTAVRRRRILLPVVAGTVAAGVLAAGLITMVHPPARWYHAEIEVPTPTESPMEQGLRLGPVVRPVAFTSGRQPVAAAEHLRALAGRLAAAPYEAATGRYAHIHTIGWNAVFDDAPGGNARRIHPTEKQMWYAADRSGRVSSTLLPTVYPNEESYRYWQNRPAPRVTPTPTVSPRPTSVPQVNDLPAGSVGPELPLPSDPAELADRLAGDPFASVRDIYEMYLVPRATRAELLRILADQPGVEWRGEATDRAGRKGLAISIDGDTVQQVLIFDPRTGVLLAWDEIERPIDTVAGSTLFLGYTRVDQPG